MIGRNRLKLAIYSFTSTLGWLGIMETVSISSGTGLFQSFVAGGSSAVVVITSGIEIYDLVQKRNQEQMETIK